MWRLHFLLPAVIGVLWTMLEAPPSSLPIYQYNRGGGGRGGGFKNSWYPQHHYFVNAFTMSSQIPDHLNLASPSYWSEHQSLQWKQLLLIWSFPKSSPPLFVSFGGLWLYLEVHPGRQLQSQPHCPSVHCREFQLPKPVVVMTEVIHSLNSNPVSRTIVYLGGRWWSFVLIWWWIPTK